MNLETELRDVLERLWTRSAQSNRLGSEIAPENLRESIRYSLLSPGKRIRPRLVLACGEMLGLPREVALPPALALEMIHCFTLIHDDLPCMDDDDFRRGAPTNHKVFGEGMALLAGDALIPMAIETYAEVLPHLGDPSRWIRGLRRFTTACGPRGVIGGQAAESLLGGDSDLAAMTLMHAQKTGALFTASILVPMELAGIDEHSPHGVALERFSREIGLAFQIADDLEDAATEEVAATSILFYRPAAEVREEALKRLSAASAELEALWPQARQNLSLFAAEIARKIEATSS